GCGSRCAELRGEADKPRRKLDVHGYAPDGVVPFGAKHIPLKHEMLWRQPLKHAAHPIFEGVRPLGRARSWIKPPSDLLDAVVNPGPRVACLARGGERTLAANRHSFAR